MTDRTIRQGSQNFGLTLTFLVLIAGSLAGCIQIETPDKPIEINLNINIQHAVVYRIDGDAKQLIEDKADIF